MKIQNPSEVYDTPWLYAVYDKEFKSSDSTGKWLSFFSISHVDDWWQKIAAATIAGELGPVAKVSTMMPTKHDGRRRVICVYTWSIDDDEDNMRVRGRLRELGVTWKINYKGRWQTAAGISGSLFSA